MKQEGVKTESECHDDIASREGLTISQLQEYLSEHPPKLSNIKCFKLNHFSDDSVLSGKYIHEGICVRGGVYTQRAIDIMTEKGGLMSGMLLFCSLMNENSNNISIVSQTMQINNSFLWYHPDAHVNNSIEQHLFTGGSSKPHFFISSTRFSGEHTALNYMRARAKTLIDSQRCMIYIRLSAGLAAYDSGYENDVVLPPFVPFENIVAIVPQT